MMTATSCFGEPWVWRLGMFSLISFSDNYGDQTSLGTTDFNHMPIAEKLILKSGLKKRILVAMTLGTRNLPPIKI